MRRILVASDGSESAGRAVDAAADLASELKAELWIVNMIDGLPDGVVERLARHEQSSIGDALNAVADRILMEARERARKRGAAMVQLKSRSGDCAEGILQTAQEIGADLIFVGRRGRSRLQGLLIGSVSQKLASLAPCIVAIVP
ncbi:MAG: universal stress protein [Hyphomicrobiales bacterium]|nr:universal stress protein [Hyphomicrobiales bacterium]